MQQPDVERMLRLMGYPQQTARDYETLPPGGGNEELPHYMTFGQIVNSVSRVYRWSHDEALRHSRENALAIRRDPVVFEALRARQIPTAQLPWHLEAEDDTDTAQAEAQAEVTKVIERIPNFQQFKMHLLEAEWYGRYGSNLVYAWDFNRGRKSLKIIKHVPINGDKLVFNYEDEVGVLVHPNFTPPDGSQLEVTDRGRAWMLRGAARDHFVIHRYEPEDSDFLEPELAGGIHGKGIRDRIYWFWWLRSQVSAWLMDYLERVGAGGFTIYFFEAGNPQSQAEVKAAAEEQHRNNTILFPRYRDGNTGGPGIQRIEPSNAGAQLLQALVSNYFDQVIRRFILGQNLTSEAVGTGLGSGVADLHADTFARLVKYDAIALGETLTTDLVGVIQRTLFPGTPPLRFVFDVDKPNAADVLESAERFFNMGGAVDEDELRSVIGLARPQPGHAILAQMGSMQPAALGGMPPMGVPMIGQPGPDMGMGGTGGPGGAMDMAAYYSRDGKPRGAPLSRVRYQRYNLIEPSEGAPVGEWVLTAGERRFLSSLMNYAVQRDQMDVAAMAEESLRGDARVMMMLHDALIDAGYAEDSDEVGRVADMAAYVLRTSNRNVESAATEDHRQSSGDGWDYQDQVRRLPQSRAVMSEAMNGFKEGQPGRPAPARQTGRVERYSARRPYVPNYPPNPDEYQHPSPVEIRDFNVNSAYAHERDLLSDLRQSRDQDVAEMARAALENGDTRALIMLHDALLDAGYDPDGTEVASVLDMATHALGQSRRNNVPAYMDRGYATSDFYSQVLPNLPQPEQGNYGYRPARQRHLAPQNRKIIGQVMQNLPQTDRPAPAPPQQYRRRRYGRQRDWSYPAPLQFELVPQRVRSRLPQDPAQAVQDIARRIGPGLVGALQGAVDPSLVNELVQRYSEALYHNDIAGLYAMHDELLDLGVPDEHEVMNMVRGHTASHIDQARDATEGFDDYRRSRSRSKAGPVPQNYRYPPPGVSRRDADRAVMDDYMRYRARGQEGV